MEQENTKEGTREKTGKKLSLPSLKANKKMKIALAGLTSLLLLIATIQVFSEKSLTTDDIRLADAICNPLGGLHSVKVNAFGATAVTCNQRTSFEYICLDRVVNQDQLREVNSLMRCVTSNDLPEGELNRALEGLNQEE